VHGESDSQVYIAMNMESGRAGCRQHGSPHDQVPGNKPAFRDVFKYRAQTESAKIDIPK